MIDIAVCGSEEAFFFIIVAEQVIINQLQLPILDVLCT